MIRVGVVIPYYQEMPGLLTKAIASVLNQRTPDDVKITVVMVNDASPCSPEAELRAFDYTGRHDFVSLTRLNGGPGAARNTGLDYLAHHPVDFVALLDSDDVWLPEHLSRALNALDDDADFYFSDHRRDYSFQNGASYFSGNVTIQRWLDAPAVGPFESTDDPKVLRLRSSWGLMPFMQDCLAQTSTVVYRQSRLGHLRFDPSLRIAGEDLLFFLSLTREAREVRLTTEVDVLCERGVNIFHSTLTWDHPNTPARFAYQLLLWRHVRGRFKLTRREATITALKIAGFGRAFSYIWLRALLKTGHANRSLLKHLQREGWLGWRILPYLADAMRRRAMRLPMFPEH